MKRVIFGFTLLMLICSMLLVSCDSSEKFLADYEKFAQRIEEAAENEETNQYAYFEKEMLKYDARVVKIKQSGKWSKSDETDYNIISGRITLAMAKLGLYKTTDGFLNTLKGIGERLSN